MIQIDIYQLIQGIQENQEGLDDLHKILDAYLLGVKIAKSDNDPKTIKETIQQINTLNQLLKVGKITTEDKIQEYDKEINQIKKAVIEEKKEQIQFQQPFQQPKDYEQKNDIIPKYNEDVPPQSIIISEGVPSSRKNIYFQQPEEQPFKLENKQPKEPKDQIEQPKQEVQVKLRQPNYFGELQEFQARKLVEQSNQEEKDAQFVEQQPQKMQNIVQQQIPQQNQKMFQGNQNPSLLEYARKESLKQCRKCGAWVELSFGCNHVTCTCGHQFCFNCLKDWVGQECRCLGLEEMIPEPEVFVQEQPKQKKTLRHKLHREVDRGVKKIFNFMKKIQ